MGVAEFAEAWNFGPGERDEVSVRHVADRLSALWDGGSSGSRTRASTRTKRITCGWTPPRHVSGWAAAPRWDLDQALASIAAWHAGLAAGEDARALVLKQVEAFGAAPVSALTARRRSRPPPVERVRERALERDLGRPAGRARQLRFEPADLVHLALAQLRGSVRGTMSTSA